MTAFYHVCFAVPDLERAMRDFENATGVEWHEPQAGELGDWRYRIVFTKGGAPFVELIEGPPGSPWDATAGARFDHLGYWTTDLRAGAQRLEEHGIPEDFSGCPHGRAFAYHRMDSIGARIELVEASRQPAFLETWHPTGAPMPAIDESQ
ncbi:Glyoxalase/Bleomycin resistance protein/Dioxygenase superfamily protein [Saccharopolyspora antimicrobica]|uniref:Glyoxalase/bleomycin resistance protein/dioxygenase superfamily protein n=1 Tax=Saccharopolyspora antimicrobica TaxID=455193 RepID=A0A1I4Y6Y3_9PSEU|nr:VOC family protein [Saccharopolyspora antimicrobica]RKT82549.1 glyoxalase/bleomycin resistance protein/dioxygenase superfamily protein [Saccharopolyspora antimicrobica]SFN33765.1 Glyoxalase/Bleomycin resistance protein/Dioxygenase superfamily protein [Saccharopolyspora antimicrobica]